MSAHDDEDAPQAAPKTAEEAQRFKAMNAIEASNNDAGSGSAEVDSEALGKAMQGLQGGKKKEEDNAWKTVKVEAGDVTVLVGWTLWAGVRNMLNELDGGVSVGKGKGDRGVEEKWGGFGKSAEEYGRYGVLNDRVGVKRNAYAIYYYHHTSIYFFRKRLFRKA